MMAVLEFLRDNVSILSMVFGFIYVVVSKVVSNEKAGGFISKMQKALDKLSFFVLKLGEGLGYLSKILAEAIKSDGFLGKK